LVTIFRIVIEVLLDYTGLHFNFFFDRPTLVSILGPPLLVTPEPEETPTLGGACPTLPCAACFQIQLR
jgi:hypothetical protein